MFILLLSVTCISGTAFTAADDSGSVAAAGLTSVRASRRRAPSSFTSAYELDVSCSLPMGPSLPASRALFVPARHCRSEGRRGPPRANDCASAALIAVCHWKMSSFLPVISPVDKFAIDTVSREELEELPLNEGWRVVSQLAIVDRDRVDTILFKATLQCQQKLTEVPCAYHDRSLYAEWIDDDEDTLVIDYVVDATKSLLDASREGPVLVMSTRRA